MTTPRLSQTGPWLGHRRGTEPVAPFVATKTAIITTTTNHPPTHHTLLTATHGDGEEAREVVPTRWQRIKRGALGACKVPVKQLKRAVLVTSFAVAAVSTFQAPALAETAAAPRSYSSAPRRKAAKGRNAKRRSARRAAARRQGVSPWRRSQPLMLSCVRVCVDWLLIEMFGACRGWESTPTSSPGD